MLAIGRALMSVPKVILPDEPSHGLAPMPVAEIFGIVRQLVKAEKLTVLLVEQNATMALDVAQHGYVMENGRIVLEGRAGRAAGQYRHSRILSRPERGRLAQVLSRG
jgi:branched-chain amino acid transport system ATP-binding protein